MLHYVGNSFEVNCWRTTSLNYVSSFELYQKSMAIFWSIRQVNWNWQKRQCTRWWSVCSLTVKAPCLLTICLMQVLATRSAWSTSIWACTTTPSSAGLSTTCSRLSLQSCRGWHVTTRGTHLTALLSSAPVITDPPVQPKSSSSE